MAQRYRHVDLASDNEPPFGAFAPDGRVLAIGANPDIVRAPAFSVSATGPGNVTIACVAAAGLERADTLKADTEGFEDRAFPPYLDTTPRHMHPVGIVIEHTGRAQWNPDCFEVLERHGYRLLGTTRNNAMFESAAATGTAEEAGRDNV